MTLRFRRSVKLLRRTSRFNLARTRATLSLDGKTVSYVVNQNGMRKIVSVPATAFSYSAYRARMQRDRAQNRLYRDPHAFVKFLIWVILIGIVARLVKV